MLHHVLAALVLTFPTSAGDLAADISVREISWHLLREAQFGFSHEERAAFVVRTKTGVYGFLTWPSDGSPDSARWEGPLPGGVVAIIHTHPNWMPSPSNIDAETARAAGVPVYVITCSKITRTTGGGAEVIVSGRWYSSGGRHHSSE